MNTKRVGNDVEDDGRVCKRSIHEQIGKLFNISNRIVNNGRDSNQVSRMQVNRSATLYQNAMMT